MNEVERINSNAEVKQSINQSMKRLSDSRTFYHNLSNYLTQAELHTVDCVNTLVGIAKKFDGRDADLLRDTAVAIKNIVDEYASILWFADSKVKELNK